MVLDESVGQFFSSRHQQAAKHSRGQGLLRELVISEVRYQRKGEWQIKQTYIENISGKLLKVNKFLINSV